MWSLHNLQLFKPNRLNYLEAQVIDFGQGQPLGNQRLQEVYTPKPATSCHNSTYYTLNVVCFSFHSTMQTAIQTPYNRGIAFKSTHATVHLAKRARYAVTSPAKETDALLIQNNWVEWLCSSKKKK